MRGDYKNFNEFYPDYLEEHRDRACRRLHFLGTALVILTLAFAVAMQWWLLLAAIPLVGYGFAWTGHLVFEKNRPATFKHPLYSLAGDFVMFKDILTGRMQF